MLAKRSSFSSPRFVNVKVPKGSHGASIEDEDVGGSACCRISDQDAFRCALSIPEEFVPTPHKKFIQDFKMKKKSNINGTGGTPSLFGVRGKRVTTSKQFNSDEKWEVEREDNKIYHNGIFVLKINEDQYVKEEDVHIENEEDDTSPLPPLPPPPEEEEEDGGGGGGGNSNCQADYCRLGCICSSIKSEAPIVRAHCGKPNCFYECACSNSNVPKKDGDIRSRLRPRVSLLNWKFIHNSAEGDKEVGPTNYRQLQQGPAIFPRMRRVAAPPKRFRNEYISSINLDNLEKRKGVLNKIIKPIISTTSGIKRENVFRRNSFTTLVKSSVGSKSKVINKAQTRHLQPTTAGATMSRKLPTLKPKPNFNISNNYQQQLQQQQHNMIKGELSENQDSSDVNLEDDEYLDKDVVVPVVVERIANDGLLLLIGRNRVCFVSFDYKLRLPKTVTYQKTGKGDENIPWLYLPFPSPGESWLFHPVPDLTNSTFTYIPEINCVIPSKALQLQANNAALHKKTVALKILWIGKDNRTRHGSIYIFPALPNVLLCGPFHRSQISSRFTSNFDKMDAVLKVSSHLDGGRVGGTTSHFSEGKLWDNFFTERKRSVTAGLQQRVLNEPKSGENIPPEIILDCDPEHDKEENSNSTSSSKSQNQAPADIMDENVKAEHVKAYISWRDASIISAS